MIGGRLRATSGQPGRPYESRDYSRKFRPRIIYVSFYRPSLYAIALICPRYRGHQDKVISYIERYLINWIPGNHTFGRMKRKTAAAPKVATVKIRWLYQRDWYHSTAGRVFGLLSGRLSSRVLICRAAQLAAVRRSTTICEARVDETPVIIDFQTTRRNHAQDTTYADWIGYCHACSRSLRAVSARDR